MTWRILEGDAVEMLRTLPEASARCCVTSPPYYGLRDYGVAGQIGLEPTPAEFVEKLVTLYREVRRVLTDDGTLWLNIGDSYAAQGGGKAEGQYVEKRVSGATWQPPRTPAAGLKPKDLMGIPWTLAIALRADGWYLRSDIIWAKPNPMPESVTDRPTKAHEYLFLLAKSERYYYNADAIRERAVGMNEHDLTGPGYHAPGQAPHTGSRPKGNARTFRGGGAYTGGRSFDNSATVERDSHGNAPNITGLRNRRSVWTIATQPFPGAHFAVMPEALVAPCILAGSEPGDTILDPMCGAATVGVVARRLGRNFVGAELNPDYVRMGSARIVADAPLFNTPVDGITEGYREGA